MSDLKPVASLNPKLLARKGGARPAMRVAMSALAVSVDGDFDDLGWNDMGHDEGGEVVSIHGDVAVPEVVRQQRALSHKVAKERRSALQDGRRAAFTLRLDAERHLKLRLACTIKGRSAQTLVTQALDDLLSELPDVAQFAAQVANTRKN
jgi:hypothetical protein